MDSLLTANFIDSLGQYFTTLPILSFFILAVAFVVRGETAILFSVYFIQQGILSWGVVVPLAFFSIVIGDTGVYMLGRLSKGTKFSDKIENKWPKLLSAGEYLKNNAEKLIFISKFTAGLTMITMFSAGWSKIKLRRFVKIQIFTATVWMTIMGTLSYLLITGLGYLQAANVFDKIEYGILALVVLIIGGEIILQKFVKKGTETIEKAEKLGEKIEETTQKNK